MIVRNGERFLGTAIQSVLDQERAPDEIIVVDGKSADGTAGIAQSYPEVTYVLQEGRGESDAYNLGIRTAKGELVGFLSHDDLWTADKLATQVEYMQRNPQVQYTIAHFEYFLEPGCTPPIGFRRELLQGSHVGRIMETLVARKEVFEDVGYFDLSLSTAEDVDWYSRAADRNIPMAVLPQVLLKKRVHESNISLEVDKNNQNLLKALRKSIQRKKMAS